LNGQLDQVRKGKKEEKLKILVYIFENSEKDSRRGVPLEVLEDERTD
jgi:hypothetical protein